jgi:cytoskeleton protein RodZ
VHKVVDSDTENTADSAALATIGKRLAKAREDAGRDLRDVASELHLRVEVIEALEAGDEERLPAAAFIRGYVRSYARYVGLDDVALVAELPQAAEHRPVPRQRARKPYRVPSIPLGRVLVWGIVLLLLIALVLYGAPAVERLWSGRDSQPVNNTLQLPMTDSQTSGTGALLLPAKETGADSGATADKSEDDNTSSDKNTRSDENTPRSAVIPLEPVKEVVVTTGPATTEATGPAELTLRFTQDSWVEMTSRDRKLVVGTQHAGTERTIRVEPPVDILLGNAPGVEMTWRGKLFDITPYQRGKVARIKLEH